MAETTRQLIRLLIEAASEHGEHQQVVPTRPTDQAARNAFERARGRMYGLHDAVLVLLEDDSETLDLNDSVTVETETLDASSYLRVEALRAAVALAPVGGSVPGAIDRARDFHQYLTDDGDHR